MTVEQLRNAVQSQPFQPFSLHMAGGRQIRVRSPEFILVPPTNSRTFVVYQDKAFEIIDLLLVESIEVGNGKARRRKPR